MGGTCTAYSWGTYSMSVVRTTRGFTLVEMAVTVLILSLLIGFGAAALHQSGNRQGLRGAMEVVGGELRLARERAIATGQTQTIHFTMDYPPGSGWAFHLHNGVNVQAGWPLPRGCSWTGTPGTLVFGTDGSVNTSQTIVVQDAAGEQDTCYVTSSGLVLQK